MLLIEMKVWFIPVFDTTISWFLSLSHRSDGQELAKTSQVSTWVAYENRGCIKKVTD